MPDIEVRSSPVTLQDCADEPIHIPGSIQPHGFLLATDDNLERVLIASTSAETYLGRPLKLILGARLEDFLEREILGALALLRSNAGALREDCTSYLGTFVMRGESFAVVAHTHLGRRVLEFERQDRLVATELMNAVITNFVSTLGSLNTERELFHALAHQVAELTGYDRVLVYDFDDDGHGTVLAEASNGRLPSFLDIRFPGTDIPAQARRLYTLNTVRIIPDADYTPAALVGMPGEDARAFDLSFSVLRSVSPIHLEYMRNMGTLSSMSVSILHNGKLWGLVSAHHAEPHLVPYVVRSACDMLTRMASTQLNSFRTTARLHATVEAHAVQREVLTVLASEPDYLDGLVTQLARVRDITNADGVALIAEDHRETAGDVPARDVLDRIVAWLNTRTDGDVFSSSHLSAELPWTDDPEIRRVASGILAVRFSSVLRRYLIWIRPEIVSTVRWAGEPTSRETTAERLTPRNSFEEWKEIVHGRSQPWTETEIEAADNFRAALTTIGLRRAEEAIELGESRFHRLTQALPVKIFIADDTGQLTYVNDRWTQAGLAATGLWFNDPLLVSDDIDELRRRWARSVETNQFFEVELLLKSPLDSDERWNFVRVVPFQRAGGKRAGWIGTVIDLTESREREMALRMNEKLALTGRMTSVIAHEINNPLEAITNLMYLLRSESSSEGPSSTYIGMVESELERISGITKQTLRWNRETSDQPETFTGASMVDDVLRLFAGKVRNRQITVKVEGEKKTAYHAILAQVRQVMANLLSNAIDAAPLNGTVTIRLLQQGGRNGFAVADNGKGIAPQILKSLFEPFHSTKGDLGNGLGLYISREIVERHNGTIDVDSTADGTTMTVWLPGGLAA